MCFDFGEVTRRSFCPMAAALSLLTIVALAIVLVRIGSVRAHITFFLDARKSDAARVYDSLDYPAKL
jgi:hypothetical protein